MLPWMQVYNNNRYGRYLYYMLNTIPTEHAAFMESGQFAQSMTGMPYSCFALDIWILSTMNEGSNLKSGWLTILNNEKKLLLNTCNVNNVNRLRTNVNNQNYQESAP